jgi:hypothetical protein
MSALNPVGVCAAAAVLWTFATLPANSQGRDESGVASQSKTLAACEKELGRRFLKYLLDSGLVKGGSVAALSYKGFKLSNSLEQKDVTRFLKEHGLNNPKTLRKVGGPVTSFVRGNKVRGSAIAGMFVGGVMVVAEFLPPEYLPGSRAPNEPVNNDSNIIVAPPLVLTDSPGSDTLVSETPEEEINRTAQRRFGDNYEPALLLVNYAMTITEVDDGRRAIFSDLRKCAEETRDNFPPRTSQRPTTPHLEKLSRYEQLKAELNYLRDKLSLTEEADINFAFCLQNKPRIVCELIDPRVVKITKHILSHVVYENSELSWEMSDFE